MVIIELSNNVRVFIFERDKASFDGDFDKRELEFFLFFLMFFKGTRRLLMATLR
jgi:hypothetical protein